MHALDCDLDMAGNVIAVLLLDVSLLWRHTGCGDRVFFVETGGRAASRDLVHGHSQVRGLSNCCP
jgi:hypothetical protein